MLEETSYYGLVDSDFLDAIDPVDTSIAEALYTGDDCIVNSTNVDTANNHSIAQSLSTLSAANDMFWHNMKGE